MILLKHLFFLFKDRLICVSGYKLRMYNTVKHYNYYDMVKIIPRRNLHATFYNNCLIYEVNYVY